MDPECFDRLARPLSMASRRASLRALLGGIATVLLAAPDGEAKGARKHDRQARRGRHLDRGITRAAVPPRDGVTARRSTGNGDGHCHVSGGSGLGIAPDGPVPVSEGGNGRVQAFCVNVA